MYRQIVGIPKGTNCAFLIGEFLMFCYEKQMVSQINPTKFQLNKVNSFISETNFLDYSSSITNGIVSSKT